MKKYLILLTVLFSLMLTSCLETALVTSEELYEIDNTESVACNTIITYGTPYYINGMLNYYIYNGTYYYPYYWNNHRYFRPYRPQPNFWHKPYNLIPPKKFHPSLPPNGQNSHKGFNSRKRK